MSVRHDPLRREVRQRHRRHLWVDAAPCREQRRVRDKQIREVEQGEPPHAWAGWRRQGTLEELLGAQDLRAGLDVSSRGSRSSAGPGSPGLGIPL